MKMRGENEIPYKVRDVKFWKNLLQMIDENEIPYKMKIELWISKNDLCNKL